MNHIVTAIAIVATLSIVQGCTQLDQVKEEPKVTTTTHSNVAHVEETDHSHPATHTDSHGEHGDDHANTSTSTQAKLTTTGVITPNTPTTLQIEVQDQDGNAIAQFDQFQEQIMHLIAVSDDLQVFQHLHPIYKGNGRFEVETQFPQAGNYTLFSDYQPTGQAEQVSVLKTQIEGDNPAAAQIDLSYTKTFGQTTVSFAPTAATIKTGEEVILQFDLQDTASNQPITDLQPYLGEKGHLVIVRQSTSLTRDNYIHAHAVHDTPGNQVHFATRFPQPGRYKLWGQFNRNGEIITADFWVEVVP
ncbi:hypothetical protein H6G89_20660 [Oscillatoria sp. FACHB-1407]|uniref:hypothetical protein n=1 Tax=Oscillatoria sp. FACHB-1407 TaxID=2692847 RepID=UPI001688F820|nr:hypothetical protein [Oscillatoria sp. FACHB-1407]MBD2463425.1 hypothetical protein [Oscillatoria sp. FACHB-1407]